LRRWQALVLLAGVLASANASVFSNLDTLARPILQLLAPGHGIAWRCGYLLLLLAAAALWAHMQRDQIAGGGFMQFAGSLPFSARQRRRVDLAVLALADSPLLLMVAGALSSAMAQGAPAAHGLLLAALVPLALAAQLAVLERSALAGAFLAAACLPLAACFGTVLAPMADVLAGAGAWLALQRPPWPRGGMAARLRWPAPRWPTRMPGLVAGRHAPALRLSWAILLRERRDETLAKALGAAAMVAAALGLGAVFEHDARSIAAAWLAQGLVALHLSGLFRGLHMAHRAGAGFSGALPLRAGWWRRFDLLALLGFGLPFLGAPALLAWHEGATPARALAGWVSHAALLCALRAPQLASERHAVVLSTLLAGCWIAATIACLY